nr:hypothetical protein [Tanacetum cinerariifolium]
LKLKELMNFCTNLSNKVIDLESKVVDIKSTYQARIKKLESRVERLEEENMVLKELKIVTTAGVDVNAASIQDTPITAAKATKVSVSRKKRGVIIQDPEETTKTVAVQPKVQEKDKGKSILIEEPKLLKRQAKIKIDEEVTRHLEAELNANVDWNVVIEQVQRKEKLTDAITKKQKMEQETEELKKHLQIVSDDDDDDVYTDATPLALKILIIDYKIHIERN